MPGEDCALAEVSLGLMTGSSGAMMSMPHNTVGRSPPVVHATKRADERARLSSGCDTASQPSSHAQLEMPPAAGEALRQEGFLYLEQRFTGGRHNISARVNTQKLRSPFHLTCTLPVRDTIVPQLGAVQLPTHAGWNDCGLASVADLAGGSGRINNLRMYP